MACVKTHIVHRKYLLVLASDFSYKTKYFGLQRTVRTARYQCTFVIKCGFGHTAEVSAFP